MADNGLSDLSMGMASLKVAGSLLLLLGVLLLGFYLLRRFGPRAGLRFAAGDDLKLLAQVSLGPKRQLILVRFLNKLLLIGVTESNIQLISEADAIQSKTFESELQKAPHNKAFHSDSDSNHPADPKSGGG